MNNLNRGDENIASTMLFSSFNRVLSNLYEDKLQIGFVPSEEMDFKKIEVLKKLAQNDFREMDMSRVEYDWTWDTMFFSKGFVETYDWDKKRKLMIPKVANPLAFGYDPFFSEPQQWRYYWKWILKPGWEIQSLIKKGVIDGIRELREIPAGLEPDLWTFKVQREQAKKLVSTGEASLSPDSENIYQILEIYTTDLEGNKIRAWVDKGFSHVLMAHKLDLKDAEDGGSKWPIVVKELFREPHSSTSFSIPDLIEDKHRAESVLMNLIFIAAKDEANPLYQYVPGKVKDITQMFQRQISQHIPVEEINAIAPLNMHQSLSNSLIMFLTMLKGQASDTIGTGNAFNPLKKGGKETATQAALQQQMNDLVQSLQTKVLQIGEKEFWSHWYNRYLRHTKEGDEKIISLTSVKGVTFEKIDLGDIRTKYPPKVEVYSAKEAEYKELVMKRDMMQIYPAYTSDLDASGKKNFDKYVFLPKFVDDSSVIDLVIPKTIDEMNASDENDMLDNDKMADVKETDNHEEHLYVHASAKNTPATITHRYWHQELLALQKKQEKLMAQAQPNQVTPVEQKPPQPNVPVSQTNPQNAAIPLNQATSKLPTNAGAAQR